MKTTTLEAETSTARKPLFVGSDVYRKPAFGKHHPLSIVRVSGVVDVCEMMGWFEPGQFRHSPRASAETLMQFHDPDYVRAVQAADARGSVSREVRDRYRLGTMENPLFNGLYRRATTAVGGSILAAELALQHRVAFHPSGGTHHGRPDRASGFCYFNDPVFAILTFLNKGIKRVLYVDIDAHHGDGVQDAFEADPRVLTISIHEEKRWPYSGLVDDRGQGAARNLPVPRGMNDSEFRFLIEEAVIPMGVNFRPEAVVITCGADGLAGDPLSGMELSNVSLWWAVEAILKLSSRNVVLGGGGYNPWTVIRLWAGLWGRLNGRKTSVELPGAAQSFMAELQSDLVDEEDVEPHWLNSLEDIVRHGEIRPAVLELPARVLN